MSQERDERAEELLSRIRKVPIEHRAAWLDSACDDPELRRTVASLLPFLDTVEGDVLDRGLSSDFEPPGGESRIETEPQSAGQPGPEERIGRYRIRQLVGEGGMGQVYEAEQERPVRRRVALKLIKAGMDSKQVLARFEAERQALALMDHPGIARIYDAGSTPTGRPYFAMEYVPGDPISTYCDRHNLSIEERITLLRKTCDAVQHAHQKGVIHRDLKPSNILVRLVDGQPAPTIIDFGVAKAIAQKLTERTQFTQLGAMVGTPEYMSPEQADLTGLDVDTRTDVYSLGVVLYELLVGVLPFGSREMKEANFNEIRRRIREDEPSRPSVKVRTLDQGVSEETARRRRASLTALRRTIKGDLDWITMKALEKDRSRRYGSPAELSADLARFLNEEPVLAGPPDQVYRLRKFVRRHRVGVLTGTLILAALVLGLVGTAWQAVLARRAAAEERRQREIAESARVQSDLEYQRARAVQDFLKYGLGFVNPRTDQGEDLTVRRMLDSASRDMGYVFDGRPIAEAAARGMLARVYYSLMEYQRSAEESAHAIELAESQLADVDRAYSPWHDELLGLLVRRQPTGIVLGEEGTPRQFDLRQRIYETGMVILGHYAPVLVDPLERVVEMASGSSAPKVEEWEETIGKISGLYERTQPDPRAVTATVAIVGVAMTHLSNNFGFSDENAAWWLVLRMLDDSPGAGPEDRAMLLWIIVRSRLEEPERSLQLAEQMADLMSRIYPPNNFMRGDGQVWLGDALRRVGRYEEAETAMLEGYRTVSLAIGPDHFYSQMAVANIELLYEEWQQPEKLSGFRERVESEKRK